jgi:hypothetical protein
MRNKNDLSSANKPLTEDKQNNKQGNDDPKQEKGTTKYYEQYRKC